MDDPTGQPATVILAGASDDLVEIEGTLSEEFPYRGDDNDPPGELVAFSDGTVLRIQFSQSGVWRIQPVSRGSAHLNIVQAPEDDDMNYSDRAELRATTDPLVWAVIGRAIVQAGT